MKTYPSIPSTVKSGVSIYAFDKLDGSNIRAEFSTKKGFYKFGSRKRLLGSDQGVLTKAKDLIKKQEDDVFKICKKNRWDSVILFYEFYGPKSKFGSHDLTNRHDVYLIDANPYKKGVLPPKDFIKIFKSFNTANLLYHGFCDDDFVKSVRFGVLDGVTSEGVVCKAKGKGNTVDMFKIKTDAWYEDLRKYCNNDKNKFNQLK